MVDNIIFIFMQFIDKYRYLFWIILFILVSIFITGMATQHHWLEYEKGTLLQTNVTHNRSTTPRVIRPSSSVRHAALLQKSLQHKRTLKNITEQCIRTMTYTDGTTEKYSIQSKCEKTAEKKECIMRMQ